MQARSKSFLLLFLEKEGLAFLTYAGLITADHNPQ